MSQHSLRHKAYLQISPAARLKPGLSWFNKLVVWVVVISSIIAILVTEPSFHVRFSSDFRWFEIGAGVFFLTEYGLRIWVAPEGYPELNPWKARLKFMVSPLALLDLLIILSIFTPMFVQGSTSLRILRVLRIIALARLTEMSQSANHLWRAISDRRYDLWVTIGMSGALMLFGATALYWIEGHLQPEQFGSIPRALWWSVITITSVGYGDAVPITVPGRLIGSLVAMIGVALVAMPTGILAAAFSDGMQRRREEQEEIKEELEEREKQEKREKEQKQQGQTGQERQGTPASKPTSNPANPQANLSGSGPESSGQNRDD